MAFTVKGNIAERKYTLTYEGPGKLSGDRFPADLTAWEAKKRNFIEGPVGQYHTGDLLADPLAALFLIKSIFTTVDEVTGDVPEAEEPPEGAII